MSKNAHFVLLAATSLLALEGCATRPDIHVRGDAFARSTSARTFAILPVQVSASVPPATATAVSEAAQTGARDRLRELGYTETGITNTDLVFYVHGKAMTPAPVTQWGYQPDPGRFGLKPSDMTATADRRVFVEAYDNHSKRQVWLGWIECSCRTVNPERIQDEIERIVAAFPPRSRS